MNKRPVKVQEPEGPHLNTLEYNRLALFADLVQAVDSLSAERRKHVDLCSKCRTGLSELFEVYDVTDPRRYQDH
ncbi:MAG: hypothetical protein A3K07_01235 [Candidatus Doudnabacteria bacterium RIFCSPHIGHO2_01_43_10]|nr:MAG: hypothetical protein A3K07_01235 [Candidatus Doudnabacteria bacterium RIFCSPHIGHO2_01_43_10]